MLPQRVRMTDEEADAVRRSFVRRQIGVLVLSGLAFIGFVVAISIEHWTLLLRGIFIAAGVSIVVSSLFLWSCPRCGELFGRNWLITQCPHCFAELTKRT